MSDLALTLKPGAKHVDLAALEVVARGYLPKVAAMMGVDARSLVLNRGRSGQPAGHVWFVDFDLVEDGLVIEGARVVFRVNNGNLVQFGAENLPAPGAAVPPTRLTRGQALSVLAKHIGGFSSTDTFIDGGSLHLVPSNLASTRSADGFDFGSGRGIAKIWQFTFHRDGVVGTWQGRVDASTGELLELADVNRYGQATGGVYQNSPATGIEIVRPMPYADLSTGGSANSAGLFSGGPLSSTLAGPFVRIADTCGAISLATNGAGDLSFGTSTGTDCATPGVGGAGNTHSARQQFYQVNRIKEVGRGWLPGNAWLGQQLTTSVNLNQLCNAYWNGVSLNFFKSGGGCGNTGEIAGVSLHEYGHGLDQNDGSGFSTDGGESYADVTAVIALHNSCMGPGFFQSSNCGGYGDTCTACTGVRDVDYAKHVSNTPATVANFTQPRCSFGGGPCGREVHCESYVSSEAIWDFANRDLPGAGNGSAWTILDRLWYLSRSTATTSFICHTGTTYTSDGCSAGSWWRTMRVVDDDDGNLANGTPHGGALFAAFNRHGIACASDPGAGVTFAGCAAPTMPALVVTGGNNSASLSWSSSGAGVVYDVFRNETGCNAGFTKISSGGSASSLTDNAVANGLTYYYQVTAFPAGNEACASTPSTCVAVTPALQPPTASFLFSCTGLTCSFDGSGSVAGSNPIASYAWTFGDTGTGAGVTASHTYGATNSYTVTLTVTDTQGLASSKSRLVSVTSDPPTASETYVALTPCRLVDTRNTSPLSSGVARAFNVSGQCGVPSSAKAVSFNVTAVGPTNAGFLIFYPTNLPLVATPSINFVPATSPRANNAILRLATDGTGTVSAYPFVIGSPGQVNLILDITGYFSEATGGLGFQTVSSCRILDTRTANNPLVVAVPRNIAVQGSCGGAIPVGASAAWLNVVAIQPTAMGYVNLWPSNVPFPTTSAINFNAGEPALANGARIGLSPTTPDLSAVYGAVVSGSTVHFIVDGNGYFSSSAPMRYHPMTPCRELDTRAASQGAPALQTSTTRNVQVQGNCGVPVGAKAAVLNVTVVGPTVGGHLQLFPSGHPLPSTTTLNFNAGEAALGNETVVDLAQGVNLDLSIATYSPSSGTLNVIIDVFGYFQ